MCPRVAVLSEAGSLTRFAPGAGRDILDIDFQATMTRRDLVTECDYPDKGGQAAQVVVQVAPVLTFGRGAANTDRKAKATYFVSVVRNEEILTKQEFVAESHFVGNRSRVFFRDDKPPITIDIPLSDRKGARRVRGSRRLPTHRGGIAAEPATAALAVSRRQSRQEREGQQCRAANPGKGQAVKRGRGQSSRSCRLRPIGG